MTQAQQTTNDWQARMEHATKTMRKKLGESERIVPTMSLQHVAPYLGILIQAGVVETWQPDSEENVKSVTATMADELGIGSTKGLMNGTQEFRDARTDAANFKKAVRFWAACSVLAQRTGLGADTTKLRVPVAWLSPEIMEYDDDSERMVQCTKLVPIWKDGQAIPLKQQSGLYANLAVTANMTTIITAAFGKKVRAAKTPDAAGTADAAANADKSGSTTAGTTSSGSSHTTITLREALTFAHSLIARADYVVSGDAFDVLHDLLTAFADASDANRAALLAVATGRSDLHVKRGKPVDATDDSTTIEGECLEIVLPLTIEHDYTPSADVIEIADHVGNAIAA